MINTEQRGEPLKYLNDITRLDGFQERYTWRATKARSERARGTKGVKRTKNISPPVRCLDVLHSLPANVVASIKFAKIDDERFTLAVQFDCSAIQSVENNRFKKLTETDRIATIVV